MQRVGLPVGPSQILERANKVFFPMQPTATRLSNPVKSLTKGCVDQASVYRLFYTMAALVIKLKLSDSRIFNMDETAFMPKGSSRKVVALKGSSNVWSREAKPNFHMTVVAVVNAAGAAIVTGQDARYLAYTVL
ncbi:hypothetical protein BBJ28_00022653 [Nothophytophthora sp. Chile5]|nr:hypothetical protein BBJ28_00022653 [Nothophytophthora sp. Chile5]